MTSESDVWYFWNNCRSGRSYPRRPVKRIIKHLELRTVICSYCGKEMVSYGAKGARKVWDRGKWKCRQCAKEEIENIRCMEIYNNRLKSEESISRFRDALTNCQTMGTCDILRAHHEALIDDPERLSSEFLIKMVCGERKSERYVKPIDVEGAAHDP